ncbi:MAG: glycosyltransferase family 87 protein [Acetobacteraceae bacterium]
MVTGSMKPSSSGQHIKLQYPPTSLLPLDLLDWFGAGSARLLNGLNIALMLVNAGCMGLLANTLLSSRLALRGWRRLAVGAGAVLSALAFYPVTRGLQLGQIQIWLDLCFTAACLSIAYRRELAAGVLMGIASTIKPQFLPFLLVSALLRHWRFLAGFTAVAAGLGVISLWRYGLHNHLAYLDVLRFITRHGEAFFSNNSVNGIVNRLVFNGNNLGWEQHSFAPFNAAVYIATAGTGVGFMAIPFLLRPLSSDLQERLLHFCLSALCFVIASPVVWEHHYGILPAIYLVALRSLLDQPSSARRPLLKPVLLAVSWMLCASKLDPVVNRLSGTILNPLQATHFWGAILLLVVLMLELIGRRRSLRASLLARTAHPRAIQRGIAEVFLIRRRPATQETGGSSVPYATHHGQSCITALQGMKKLHSNDHKGQGDGECAKECPNAEPEQEGGIGAQRAKLNRNGNYDRPSPGPHDGEHISQSIGREEVAVMHLW